MHFCFLFNHDAEHQVRHTAPIISAMCKTYPEISITALASSDSQFKTVQQIVGRTHPQHLILRKIATPAIFDSVLNCLNGIAPIRRLYTLARYRALFEQFDCLIVPEMTSTLLKTLLGLSRTPLILLPHGAGDRTIGFTDEIKQFDFVLISGTKVRDRMLAQHLIRQDNHCVVGYPKFDTIHNFKSETQKFFENNRPTILYNPHFDPRLSSWYDMGKDVLEFFASHNEFNLICAPHVMLFKKWAHFSLESGVMRRPGRIAKKYLAYPNIKIDLGSDQCLNMAYTMSADVYLGDVSSQVYEFLRQPRPCIFLNSHRANWRGNQNYKFWNCGPVLSRVTDLTGALDNLESAGDRYRDIQIRSFAETFHMTETPASIRAADAIVSFMKSRPGFATL